MSKELSDDELRAQINALIRDEIQEGINEYVDSGQAGQGLKGEGFVPKEDEDLTVNIPTAEIEKLLKEMHKDIRELINLENLEKGTEAVKEKSMRITKICMALQSTLDHENGGIVAHHLDHLYKHIRYAVVRVRDQKLDYQLYLKL